MHSVPLHNHSAKVGHQLLRSNLATVEDWSEAWLRVASASWPIRYPIAR